MPEVDPPEGGQRATPRSCAPGADTLLTPRLHSDAQHLSLILDNATVPIHDDSTPTLIHNGPTALIHRTVTIGS